MYIYLTKFYNIIEYNIDDETEKKGNLMDLVL